MSDDEEDVVSDPPVEWTPENEIHLFNALEDRRPVGLNRNFQMVFISEKFNNLMNRDVPSSVLWDHLSELYDMDTLNENDSPPGSVAAEKDFALPSDFDELCGKKTSNQTDSAPVASQKGTSLLKPAVGSTPKQKKSESARKEGRPVKDDEGKGDVEVFKVAKKKGRPPADPALRNPSSSSKKRRNN